MGSTRRYLHADGLGSIVKATDSDGVSSSDVSYDAFGAPADLVPASDAYSPFGFTAREWDPGTELYHYRARYYDPKIGRFISEDPIGFGSGDANFYAYASNRPTVVVDPFGLAAMGYGLGGTGSLIPIPGKPGPVADGSCAAVIDFKGNIGLMCCWGVGVGVGESGTLGGGLVGFFCPNCDTICDMPGEYVQVSGAAAGGGGGSASGGASTTNTSVTLMGSVGVVGGGGGYVATTTGKCTLLTTTIPCDKCR